MRSRPPPCRSCSPPRLRARPMPSRWCSRRASLSYGELDARANQLAHHLRESRRRPRGGGRAVHGALARDARRAPRHPQSRRRLSAARPVLPAERLAFMLADAGAPLLVTHSPLLDRLPAHAASIVLPRCRLARHRAAAKHRTGKPRSTAQHRLCHLHLRIHRNAKGGLRHTCGYSQSCGCIRVERFGICIRSTCPSIRSLSFRCIGLGDCEPLWLWWRRSVLPLR